jgi:hypothetical protein
MRVHNFVRQQGQFETSTYGQLDGFRTFGFPSIGAPQVGDLFVTDRQHAKVCYEIVEVTRSIVYDHACDGLPEIRFYSGRMRDVFHPKIQCFNTDMQAALRAAGLTEEG